MREVTLDLTSFEEKISLHRYLKETLGFPFYYGANLDALHDLLTAQAVPIHLELQGLGDAGFPILALQRVLRDCEEVNPRITVSW